MDHITTTPTPSGQKIGKVMAPPDPLHEKPVDMKEFPESFGGERVFFVWCGGGCLAHIIASLKDTFKS